MSNVNKIDVWISEKDAYRKQVFNLDVGNMMHNVNKSEIWILEKLSIMKICLEFGFRVLEI
jgi:hypothetical protein